jgi:hypothetical protein
MKIASTIVETKDSECKCIERDTENGNYVDQLCIFGWDLASSHDEFKVCKSEQTAYNAISMRLLLSTS